MKQQPRDKAVEGRGERMDRRGEGEGRRREGGEEGEERGRQRNITPHTPGMETSWLMKGP